MKESDQEIVNRLVSEQAAHKRRTGLLERLAQRVRGAVIAAPITVDPLPPEVVAFLQQGQASAAIWNMHARKCRRNLLLRLKIKPENLRGHLAACQCGWPLQKLREMEAQRGA